MQYTLSEGQCNNIKGFIDNFENYSKGEYFHKVFDAFLGQGIFNADGELWKVQRKTAAQIFHVQNFQTEFIRVFLEHIQIMSNRVFDEAVCDFAVIDFHEVMLKFTMDVFVE